MTFSIDRSNANFVTGGYGWVSLFELVYNNTTGHCKLIVDKTDIFDIINEKLTITNYNNGMLSYALISNVYTKTQMDTILAGIGIIPATSGLMVADTIRASTNDYITIDDNTSITGDLDVAGDVNLSNILNVRTPASSWGNIRIIPTVDGDESSIGFYYRNDERNDTAGDVWICGVNSCDLGGFFSIGTPVLNACLSINSIGTVNIPYKLTTPTMNVRIIKSTIPELGVKIDDTLLVTGDFFTYGPCGIGGNLSVAEGGTFNGSVIIRAPAQIKANIQILTSNDYNEGSIAYY